jgi:hypothetical protein
MTEVNSKSSAEEIQSPEETSIATAFSSHQQEENKTTDIRADSKKRWFRRSHAVWALILLVIYLIGLGSGYGLWGLPTPEERAVHEQETAMAEIMAQVNPTSGYTAPAHFGDMGPKMAAAGVFDIAEFEQIYQQANQPLNSKQLAVLKEGSDEPIVFDSHNAYFLLNYFWAVGLSNKNPILDSGPIQQYSQGKVENFASTGGWTLAKKPLSEIYSKLPLISLTAKQQKNLEEAAEAVYRPCCDNPTHFPDCNHGMAMLGLMELMASQNATVPQMLEAAKYANAYWYPAQTVEQAIFFKNTTGEAYQDVDARLLLGPQYSSGSGFQAVHQYLAQNNLLPEAPKTGGSCGV